MSGRIRSFFKNIFDGESQNGSALDQKPSNSTQIESLIAVLVDFDNTVLCSADAHYKVSFDRLRDYARTFGTIAFAEVFISARILDVQAYPEIEGRVRLINSLNRSGFRVIACPLGEKDRDQVDSYLKSSGSALATNSLVQKIIVVSDDSDFNDPNFIHPIKDLGKEVVILRPSDLGDKISDVDGRGEGFLIGARKKEFCRIIDLEPSQFDSVAAETRQAAMFIRAVLSTAFTLTTPTGNQFPFKHIANLAWKSLPEHWRGLYSKDDVLAAMGAIADRGLIEKVETRIAGKVVFKHYRPNRNHPAIVRLDSLVKTFVGQRV